MKPQGLAPRARGLAAIPVSLVVIATALSVMAVVRAAEQQIDLDKNAANGAESKVSTKVLQTYPVRIENAVYNNAAGSSFIFKWPGAGPGGFNSFVTAGPGVGTVWVWSTAYQVYSIASPVTFTPARTLSVFGAPGQGIQTGTTSTSIMAPGKSINPTTVTLSDASLSSSLITFFSPEKTVASCGVQCAPGECELFLENRSGEAATVAAEQIGCCAEPHQLICGGECTSYLTDVQNCGGCGNVCAADEICSDGACVCPAGLTQCGAGCIDLQTDPTNCGACGSVCASDEHCAGGACICDPGLTQCGNGCTDLQTDASNCGGCGNICPAGGFCTAGACVCPAGQTDCGGVCVDLQNDPANCGACGNTCGTDAICTAGGCVGCRPPTGDACDNRCTNIHTDPNNCGECGNVCDFTNCPSTGQGTCSQGSSCVCAPALTSTSSTLIRFRPEPRSAPGTMSFEASPRGRVTALQGTTAAGSLTATSTATIVAGGVTGLNVNEAPVCDIEPIEQVIPAGGVYTQTLTGGRLGKEIQTVVAIKRGGETIAQGPCAQIVPVTGVDTSGVILSPVAVATRDESGDGLCQPGEAWCEFLITAADVGDSPCLDPQATLSSPTDQLNPDPITFLNATSPYPGFPGYPGDGVPLDRKTNTVPFSVSVPAGQPSDVGRPFLMSVTCSNRPEIVQMPITLGIGGACDPASLDGETYDRLDGFQSPVRARLVPQGNPVNYSTGNFNLGSTIPLKIALGCGSHVLAAAELDSHPEIVGLEHATLGPQSLVGINGDNNANPDDPRFSCTSSGCDYQFRTNPLPVGTYVVSVRMPDSRIFQAGLTITP